MENKEDETEDSAFAKDEAGKLRQKDFDDAAAAKAKASA